MKSIEVIILVLLLLTLALELYCLLSQKPQETEEETYEEKGREGMTEDRGREMEIMQGMVLVQDPVPTSVSELAQGPLEGMIGGMVSVD